MGVPQKGPPWADATRGMLAGRQGVPRGPWGVPTPWRGHEWKGPSVCSRPVLGETWEVGLDPPPLLAQAQPQQWGPWGWPHVTGGSPPPPWGSTSVCCWWRLKAGTRAGPGGGWPGARPLVAVCLPRACLRGHSGHMGRGEGPVFGSAQRGHRGRPGARGPAAGSLARGGGLTLVLDSLPAALALSLFC